MFTKARISARLRTDCVLLDGRLRHASTCNTIPPEENRYFTGRVSHRNIQCLAYRGTSISNIVFLEDKVFDESVEITISDLFMNTIDRMAEFDITIEYNKKDKNVLSFFREQFNSDNTSVIKVNNEGMVEAIYFSKEAKNDI